MRIEEYFFDVCQSLAYAGIELPPAGTVLNKGLKRQAIKTGLHSNQCIYLHVDEKLFLTEMDLLFQRLR